MTSSYYEKMGHETVCIDSELPFEIPGSWMWCRLGSVGVIKSGTTYPASLEKDAGNKLYVKVSDMNLSANAHEILTSSRFLDEYNEDHLIPVGSIIFPKRGGAIATNKKRLVLKDSILIDLNTMSITISANIDLGFFYFWFQSIDLSKLYNGTSIPQINNRDIAPLFIPIPPKQEQHRIAQAIQQILTLLSDLEKSLS